MQIRTETASDHQDVYRLNVSAFQNREDESRLIERIRSSEQFIPELSLVAEEDGQIVGHALFSKAEIVLEDSRQDVIVLAPIAVRPDRQRTGIGGKLIREGLDRTRDLGYEYVFLIGHPEYYPRFGFRPARELGFELKQFQVPDNVFLVYGCNEGKPDRAGGELRYPDSFFAN